MNNETLHVITAISNPARYQSRIRLYKDFAAHMRQFPNVVLHTVECAFGDRPFDVTDEGNINHTQVRSDSEIWLKENLLNLGMHNVARHYDAKYIAWLDADIRFIRSDWSTETIHQLQHYDVVQTWSHAIDLGPNFEMLGSSRSFCSYYSSGATHGADTSRYGYWHSGYGWAARREAIEAMGGLLDFAILGSADFYMAWSLIGRLDRNLYNDVASLPHRTKGFTDNYIRRLFQWQERAKALGKNIGCVDGTIEHYFHGSKKRRYYNSRENILINNDYDPDLDIVKDLNGLYKLQTLTPRQCSLRDQIRGYFRSRNEDSTEV